MKYILNLNIRESEMLNRVIMRYSSDLTLEEWDILDFTCRYTFNNPTIMLNSIMLSCKWNNNVYDVEVSEEASALLNKKSVISPFKMTLTMKNGHAILLKPPKNAQAKQWLLRSNSVRTTADELAYIIYHAFIALNSTMPLLNKKELDGVTTCSLPFNFEKLMPEYAKELRKKHILDGWDTVALTENQFYKVIDANMQHGNEYNIDNFALPRFCLQISNNDHTDYYFFEQKGRTIKCGVADIGNYVIGWFNIIIDGIDERGVSATLEVDENNKGLYEFVRSKQGESDSESWEWCADAFFIVNTFMLNYGDVTMEVETKTAVSPSEPSQRKRKQDRNSVRLFKCYKLVKGWKGKARKKAEIKCLAWGVRGHYRHLRNGKVVFVEAYVKGKEKDKYKGKEYDLIPYKDA